MIYIKNIFQIKMIKIINQFFLCLLIVFGMIYPQQGYAQVIFDDLKIGIDKNESEKVIFNGLQEIGAYYENNQFEQGLEMIYEIFRIILIRHPLHRRSQF